jgi:hypothetical protein
MKTVPVRDTKVYVGVDGGLHTFFTSALGKGTSHSSAGPFTHRKIIRDTLSLRGWAGSRSKLQDLEDSDLAQIRNRNTNFGLSSP